MTKCPDEPTITTDPDAPEPHAQDDVRIAKRAFVVYETQEGAWLVDSRAYIPTHVFMDIDAGGVLDACRRVVDGLRDEALAQQIVKTQLRLSRQLAETGAAKDFIESHKL